MKFSCTKENLLKALTCTGYVSGKQVNLPILQNVLISMKNTETKIVSTNLEIAVSAQLRAKVETDGEFTVPARVFLEYMANVPGDRVDIELHESGLGVQMGHSKTVLKGMEATEFPLIPGIEGDVVFELDAKVLLNALHQVLFAASKSDVRPELSGVLFHCNPPEGKQSLVLAATDSFRLAEKKITFKSGGTEEKRVIVPSRTVSELVRIINVSTKEIDSVTMRVSDHQIVFVCGGVQITSRLTDGNYPNYEHIIPKESNVEMSALKDDVVKQVKGASLFTTKGIGAVRMKFVAAENKINITSTNAQTGEHAGSVVAEGKGDEVEMYLNHRYILDGLSVIDNERVKFSAQSTDAPLVMRPQMDKDYLYMIMPIKQ